MSSEKLPLRNEVPLELTWDTSKIYKDKEAFDQDYKYVLDNLMHFEKFKGNLTKDSQTLEAFFDLRNDLVYKVGHLMTYAHLNNDVDTNDSFYQQMYASVLDLYSKVNASLSFVEPELLLSDFETIKELLKTPKLKEYTFMFEMLFRKKGHILSDREEELLAKASPVLGASVQTFSVLNNADLKFPTVKNDEGEEVLLSHGRYSLLMQSKNRLVRKEAYDAMYSTFKQLKNTFASTLSTTVKAHNFDAQVHNFNSARHQALYLNGIDESVYDALIEAIHESLPLLHRYYALRKEKLNLSGMAMYDAYTPLVEDVDLMFSYDEAKELVLETVKIFGDEYYGVCKQAFEERWIDVLENQGKRSGAYSSGTYGTVPYILLNWQGTLNDVYTLIHEMGHSIHSYYTRTYQPFIYGSYSIFLAEIASTTNENLLTIHLLNKYQDKKIKSYIINHFLDSVKATIFRQTQFAEFEHLIHQADQSGLSLTADYLSETYFDLNKKYYGESISYDENIQYEWARIPHFYYDYYVYQYATGFSAALAFTNKILNEGQSAIDKYLGFLKAGESNYPLEVLKEAGLDMSNNQVIKEAMQLFAQRLDEFAELLK